NWVRLVAFLLDSCILVSALNNCTIKLWNTAIGVKQYILISYSNWVWLMVFSPDGRLV
ncbi:hypothetical protein BO86DRAFT_277683, partial [Aspergillus japonicus CBS 114.51]